MSVTVDDVRIGVQGSISAVRLVLPALTGRGEEVTFSYDASDAGAMSFRDAAGNESSDFSFTQASSSQWSVAVASASTSGTGTAVVFDFQFALLNTSAPSADRFSVVVDGEAQTPTSVQIENVGSSLDYSWRP